LRSARARRVERVVVASFDIVDELFMLLSPALLPVERVVPLLVVPVARLVVVLDDGEPSLIVDGLLVPAAVPLDRVVLLLFIEPLVVPVAPGLGAVLWALLVGEPEAPPWPPLVEPVCASAPPHASAAAAERARILRVCLMGYS
jgi:hypothetical protein